MRAQTNEVNYVQYGVVTDCISAVIEIGEDGSNKAAIGCDGDASDESPPLKMDKHDEIIITKRICIAPDTSDMITESMSKSCARSIASPTDDLASTQVPTTRSTQEAKDRKGEKEDVDVVSVTYSAPLIEKMKAEVAITLTKMSRSCKSHESSISTSSQQKTSRVQFAETIISEVRERPRIDPDVVRDLFYSISDIERFEDEAEESSYDSSSAGNSFSYTVTPTTSYDEGNDDNSEIDTPVASEPTKDHIIGADGMVAEAYSTLLARLSSMNAPTDDKKEVVSVSDKSIRPNIDTS